MKDRILIHLRRHPQIGDLYAPAECTAKSIAQAMESQKQYISIQLRYLEAKGLIEHRRGRVNGGKRRVITYRLTHDGILLADALRGQK